MENKKKQDAFIEGKKFTVVLEKFLFQNLSQGTITLNLSEKMLFAELMTVYKHFQTENSSQGFSLCFFFLGGNIKRPLCH